jgi:hypothetical protein
MLQENTYHVQLNFSCSHCANELIKFTNKYEKITHVLLIILHLCIKFQDQIPYSLAITKKENFLTDL